MMRLFITGLCLIMMSCFSYGQLSNDYNLGIGLVILKPKFPPVFTKESLNLYKDSACKILSIEFIPQNTNCPKCMHCKDQENGDNYEGSIHPFICSGYDGIALICNKIGHHYYEVFIDTLGTKAYVSKNTQTKCTTWNEFMLNRAQKGQYFTFNRQYDSSVIYDKPYSLSALPKAGKDKLVNVHYPNINDIQFYPVEVNGYWMKLKAMTGKKKLGYCWFIWRNEKDWLQAFEGSS